MKQPTQGKLQNIVFTVAVVLCALGVYLLAGRGAIPINATAAPLETPAAEETETLMFRSVPEDVFTYQLTHGEGYLAAAVRDKPRCYGMQCGAADTGRATLIYSVNDAGYVSSVTLTFPRPAEATAKPKTLAEQKLVAAHEGFVSAQNEAVQTLLTAAFSACDLNDVLLVPVLLKWYAEALNARDEGRAYSDVFSGCTFETYASTLGKKDVFICSLLTGE